MFIKPGRKTKLEKEIAALPPGNEIPESVQPEVDSDDKSGLREFLDKHVHPSRDKDQLLDIHVGNPLRRITEILEDIKNKKHSASLSRGVWGFWE